MHETYKMCKIWWGGKASQLHEGLIIRQMFINFYLGEGFKASTGHTWLANTNRGFHPLSPGSHTHTKRFRDIHPQIIKSVRT